ncbi:MAG: hypothetical protein WC581_05070 [Thermodesulfovibrionales bacterium]
MTGNRTQNSKLLNEKGMALVMILILSAIALVIMTGLIFMITTGAQVSGLQKRYTTALEAGKGGADVTFQLLAARGDPNIPGLDEFHITASSTCMTDKLNKSTKDWTSSCDKLLTIVPGTDTTYDMYFDLGANPYPIYRVYSKIVDTVEGNSGGDEGLIGKGVVSSGSGEVTVVSRPYLYTIEVDAENRTNPSERAKLSILYQY